MRIGVLADTHIPDRAPGLPRKLREGLAGVDMIIDAGDLVEKEVLDALKGICPDVRGVAGNMDCPALRKELPQKLVFKAGKFTIGVSHGCGAPQGLPALMRQMFKKDSVDLIVFGHSHQAAIIKEGTPWLFNPGSPTDTVFAPYKSFGIIDIGDTIKLQIVKLT